MSPDQIQAPPALDKVPEDAGENRGKHFRAAFFSTANLVIFAILAAGSVIAGASAGVIAAGLAGIGVVFLLDLLVVFLIANSRSANDFYTAYAAGRHLARVDGKSQMPAVTPLLQRGDSRYAQQRFNGVLPGGLDGSLCLYTYEEETHDSDGNEQTTYIHFTIVFTELPGTESFIQELYAQRRVGFRFMDGAEDVFRKRQRVEQESEGVDKKYEIFTGQNDDMNRARQILSPTFLVWLETNSPEGFAFELVGGVLVTNVKGHKKSANELDTLCTASAAVARRLAEEAAESAGLTQSTLDPHAPPH